jgi:hypothetical protein
VSVQNQVALDSLFSFEAHELCNLLCGPELVHWDDHSLTKLLKPVGDFRLSAREVSSTFNAPTSTEGSGTGGDGDRPQGRTKDDKKKKEGEGGKGGKGGKGSSNGSGGVDTLVWLRNWLVALPQEGRLDFLELVTGQRALLPDLVIHVRRTQSSSSSSSSTATSNENSSGAVGLPYFHSCTNTLDLPRFTSEASLVTAMTTAMANGSAGGFSEVTRANS